MIAVSVAEGAPGEGPVAGFSLLFSPYWVLMRVKSTGVCQWPTTFLPRRT